MKILPNEWAKHVSQARICEIRATCELLPRCPNMERDIVKLERVRQEAEALRARAREMEDRASAFFVSEISSEWSDREIEAAFKSQRNANPGRT